MQKETQNLSGLRWLLVFVMCLTTQGAVADALSEAAATADKTHRADSQSQDRIDSISAATQALLERHRAANWKVQRLQVFIEQLQGQIRSQENKKADLKEQIDEVEVTKREIVPLMTDMINTLERFVSLDLPFQRESRLQAVEKLRANMLDAEVSVSERFRHILKAYKTESELNRSLAVGRQELQLGDRSGVFEVLRVGRVGLYCLSLDGKAAGVWNAASQAWQPMPSSATKEVIRGLKIAKDRSAPGLLELPVSAPVSVEVGQ